MRKIVLFIVATISLAGCKKSMDQIKEDLVIKAMTDGQWVITNFTENGTDITSSFTGYTFQYYSNRTVHAIKNGTVEKTGNWDGNATTMTTSASFSGVTNPLLLINGNWHIDRNSWTYVEATQVIGTTTKTMRLDKR